MIKFFPPPDTETDVKGAREAVVVLGGSSTCEKINKIWINKLSVTPSPSSVYKNETPKGSHPMSLLFRCSFTPLLMNPLAQTISCYFTWVFALTIPSMTINLSIKTAQDVHTKESSEHTSPPSFPFPFERLFGWIAMNALRRCCSSHADRFYWWIFLPSGHRRGEWMEGRKLLIHLFFLNGKQIDVVANAFWLVIAFVLSHCSLNS